MFNCATAEAAENRGRRPQASLKWVTGQDLAGFCRPRARTWRSGCRATAFTLIEMMVVIGVIGLLAGLMLGVMPAVTNKKIRSRVQVELRALETAISSYKADKGFYPPDNSNNVAQPPLFYELTGTQVSESGPNNQPQFKSIFSPEDPPLSSADITAAFYIGGFINSGTDKAEVKNFFPTLKAAAVRTNQNVKMLVVPYAGPGGDFNPWRYNRSNPTNNPGEFDLWAEVVIGGKTVTIGNWKD